MALTAAAASAPAIISFGLCRNIRNSKPRSSEAAIAAALPPRRRGMSSSIALFLGTFLHLLGLLDHGRTRRWGQRRNIAFRLALHRRCEPERQRNRNRGALADPALQTKLAALHADQALDDGKAKAGTFVATLIGLA